ncbi:MAG TPA: PadR family transcriptional regulator [Solirubrobacterales bacterium]|nr:PadR family transcriptional regulator [Solirubrobacterales bacterium]
MRRGASSPVTGALLGLLLERPGYGYELAQRLNERMGPTWKLTPSSIYPVLERLEADALVRRTVKEMPGRQRQRERVMYHATEAAAGAFEDWLRRPARRAPIRTELLARIAVARPQDAPRLLESLDEYERDCLAMLAGEERGVPGEGEQPRGWNAVLTDLIEAAAGGQLRTELEWVEFARRRIRGFLSP